MDAAVEHPATRSFWLHHPMLCTVASTSLVFRRGLCVVCRRKSSWKTACSEASPGAWLEAAACAAGLR